MTRRQEPPAIDVVGIGNALVDVISHELDSFVTDHDLARGAMMLVDPDRATALYTAMGPGLEVSGGSAANTMVGVASFGGSAAYVGRVRDDQLGEVFAHDLRATGVAFGCPPASDGPPTGRCLIVVTPDAQRTMSTCLGAAEWLGPDDVDPEVIACAAITYLEGYLFDRPAAREAYWKASRVAHDHRRRVALTLSDTFCVERHRDEWRALVADQVDVLFANEAEALVLYELDDLDEALEALRADVELAAVTRGPAGSVVVSGAQTIEVAAHPVPDVVDTTGAGDLYAAGFLYGLTHGRDLSGCGRLGSMAASAVLGHTGARPEGALSALAR